MVYGRFFNIKERTIGAGWPVYFIADIGANHDGNLGRAKDLIRLARDCGIDCAKFQHFKAEKIVSAVGFNGLHSAHQRAWNKSVFEVYEDYSINPDWNLELYDTCREVGIDFMTTPYDVESLGSIASLVKAFKIGSGDITYHSFLRSVALMQKPVFLATGASSMDEVKDAVETILAFNRRLCLMQCNTNYTGAVDNFKHVNLNVLKTYTEAWPGLPLGLSDHTMGPATVLGAIALGACVIEKHFTDDNTRRGPDHAFADTPERWRLMIKLARELESAMGDGRKICEDNEREAQVVQRRALRLKHDLVQGARITDDDLESLRPCPVQAYAPAEIDCVVGKRIKRTTEQGREIYPWDIE